MGRHRLSAALAVVVAVFPLTAAAVAEPRLELIDPDEPVSITFDARNIAQFEVLVFNHSSEDADVSAELFDHTGRAVDPDRLMLVPERINAASPAVLEIRWDAGDEAPNLESGILVLTADALGSLVVQLAISETGRALEKARVQPASATTTAVRQYPWIQDRWLFDESLVLTFMVSDISEAGARPGGVQKVVLSSDSGGRLELESQIRAVASSPEAVPTSEATPAASTADPSNEATAIPTGADPTPGPPAEELVVRVLSATHPGSYTGSILLDPALPDGPSVEVTVNVEDFAAWPLLTLVAGVLLAFGLTWFRDRHRARQALIGHLRKASEAYAAVRTDTCGDAPAPALLTEAFRLTPEGGAAELDARQQHWGDRAYREVHRARLLDEVNDAEKRVQDVTALVELLPELCSGASDLQRLIDAAQDPDAAVVAEGQRLLNSATPVQWHTSGDPTLSEQAEAFANELRDQTAAFNLYQLSRGLYIQALTIWRESLSRPERKALSDHDPDAVWTTEIARLTTREAWTTAQLERRFADILVALRAHVANRSGGDSASLWWARALPPEDDIVRVKDAMLGSYPPVERRPAEAILRHVRLLDTLDFFVATAIAMMVLFLTLYPGENFGSGWQYLSAFIAGASGALVVNWALLPWFRSYRLSGET